MIKRIIAWMNQKTIEEQIDYAGAQYALALAHGDMRRAARLKQIIATLRET